MSQAQSDDLLDRANAALGADQELADKLYEELIAAIEVLRGKNQKEVAAELQRLSRAIEAEGRLDDSMRLKQRTCEVMLRLSMAERHGNRLQLAKRVPPAAANGSSPIKKLAFMYVGSLKPASELSWLKSALGATELKRVDDHGRQFNFLALPGSVPLLVAEDEIAGPWLPVFEVENPDDTIEQIKSGWPDVLREEARLPGGKLTWLRSHTRRLGVVASSCLRRLL